MIITTPTLNDHISAVILYKETFRQKNRDGYCFSKVITDTGIILGIKVDTGAKEIAGHNGEKITEGLDGLRERREEYAQAGVLFAKCLEIWQVKDSNRLAAQREILFRAKCNQAARVGTYAET